MVSFSGGRTSAYMARLLQLSVGDYFNIVNVFMNTSVEDDKTLDFVNECDKRWGLNLVWLESVFNDEKGIGTTYSVVSYEIAKRDGSIFHAMCKKYGIPNRGFPHCNRELKLQPFNKYREDFHPGSARAIGIRIDEFERMVVDAAANGIIYPLIKWNPTCKSEVLEWFSHQPFNLMIPEHHGNCLTCWKKSDRKLFTLYHERPEVFDVFLNIENDNDVIAAKQEKNSGIFFSDYRKASDIVLAAKEEFEEFKDPYFKHIEDKANGCSDHCEPFAADTTGDMIGFDGIVETPGETLAAIESATRSIKKAKKVKSAAVNSVIASDQPDMFDC